MPSCPSAVRRLAPVLTLLALTAAARADDGAIRAAIQKQLENPAIAHGWTGVLVKSLTDQRIVFSQNADKLFIPASNMKMLVTSTSVDRLPADFDYATPVLQEGTVSGGVLTGNLYLKGSGDSTMVNGDLRTLAKAVHAAGISQVSGDIVGDGTIFDDELIPSSWEWDDLPYYYSAEVSGLTVDRGTVHVRVTPGDVGRPPTVSIEPDAGYMLVRNTATTVADSDRETIGIGRVRAANVITVTGAIRRGNKGVEDDMTMEDPAAYTASLFRAMLRDEGVSVRGVARKGAAPGGLPVITTYTSPKLPEILKLILKPSDNLMAESLLKTLGAVAGGGGSAENGAKVERDFLRKIGVDPANVFIVDGSGLSRRDLVSPETWVAILSYMWTSPRRDTFVNALPIAGVDGTLRSRMKGTAAEGKVHAKTGYVGKARNLSGYVTAKDGETYAFSLLMNHYNGETSAINQIQDNICEILASSSR
jgi:D-alanyl-D-alanine carboxypeptidase/D-alanyl-D-alanine-endopeptidase (penicillin-binding protein 4)